MKHIFFLFALVLLSLGAAAQYVSKTDFQQLVSNFINNCKQGNDYTADLGTTHLNNDARTTLNNINTSMNGQITYNKNIATSLQTIITNDSTGEIAFEAQINKESGAKKADDEVKAALARTALADRKVSLGHYKDKLAIEINSLNQVQALISDIVKTEDIKNRLGYAEKVINIKSGEDKITTALAAFAGTLE